MKTIPPTPAQTLVLEELKASQQRITDAKNSRTRIIRTGRDGGLSWIAMGEALGISGSAVQQIIIRADGAK